MAPAFIIRTPILAAAAVAVVGLLAAPVSAQPMLEELGFIMDGDPNSTDTNDWENLFDNTIDVGETVAIRDGSGALCTFLAGEFIVDTADRVAWKGGTKDFEDFDKWWNRTGASSKSDIQNAGVAAWSCDVANTADPTDDHLILQCFGDRLSTSGNTFMGCWGLQNELKFNGNRFDGDGHVLGDVLSVTNLPGNVAPDEAITEELAVWVWDPINDGIKGTLREVKAFGEGVCDGASLLTDLACSIVNEGSEPVPYPYTSSDSNFMLGEYPRAAFVEMTIDLTESSDDPDFCLATTIVEMRQSSSPSSLLDQIVLGQSPTCALIITVQCDGLGEPNFVTGLFDYSISGTVSTSAGSADDLVIDRLLPAPVTEIDGDVDGVNVAGVGWGSHLFSSAANPVTVQVRATDPDGNFTTGTSDPVQCPARSPDGDITIKKDCVACIVDNGDGLGVTIRAAGEVENTGDEVPITGFQIVETAADTSDVPIVVATFPVDFPSGPGDPAQNGKLDPGEIVSYSFEYDPKDIPTNIPGGLLSGSADDIGTFDDTVELQNVTAPFDFTVTGTFMAGAMCFLCPPGDDTAEFGLNCDPAP